MRTLNPNERRLLALLLAALFLALNLAGLRAWTQASAAQRRALAEAQKQQEECKSWLAAAEAIPETFRQPPSLPVLTEREATSTLLELVRSAAQRNGLSLMEESLPPAPPGLPERAACVRLKLTGPFAGLVRMLFELQKPGAWRAVEELIVRAEATPQNVLAEMEVRQYFKENPSTPAP